MSSKDLARLFTEINPEFITRYGADLAAVSRWLEVSITYCVDRPSISRAV
jgi:hypothetical protein